MEDVIWRQILEDWLTEDDSIYSHRTPEAFDAFVDEMVDIILEIWVNVFMWAQDDPVEDARRLYEKSMREEHVRLWKRDYRIAMRAELRRRLGVRAGA